MNIGLMGTPGSGKTDLAYQLAARLEENDRRIKIIDGYAPEIEAKTQIALGSMADYIGNLYVALERYALERVARLDHDIVITCGTFMETAVYMAMHFVALINTLSDEEKIEATPRVDAVLRMLAVLYNDTCVYDHAFYLPTTLQDEDIQFMDEQLKAGVESFKQIAVVTLSEPQTRLEDALKVLETGEVRAT